MILIIPIILTFYSSNSFACSCAEVKTPEEGLTNSDNVFSGKVVDIKRVGDENKVLFKVSSVWKGDSQTQLILYTSLSEASCGFEFQTGEEYLVYANKIDDGRLHTSFCSRTTLLSNAEEDLRVLEKGDTPAKQVELSSEMNQPVTKVIIFLVGILLLVSVGGRYFYKRKMRK
jgi:hypothetical protein